MNVVCHYIHTIRHQYDAIIPEVEVHARFLQN